MHSPDRHPSVRDGIPIAAGIVLIVWLATEIAAYVLPWVE